MDFLKWCFEQFVIVLAACLCGVFFGVSSRVTSLIWQCCRDRKDDQRRWREWDAEMKATVARIYDGKGETE